MSWGDVLGGQSGPRILILGEELCPNLSFEDDLDDYSQSHSGMAVRVEDTTTPFGNYVCRLIDEEAGQARYIKLAIEVGALGGRHFIARWFAKQSDGDDAEYDSWILPTPDGHEEVHSVDDIWRPHVNERTFAAGVTDTELDLRIYPGGNEASKTGDIRIDNLSVREVLADLAFPEPPRGKFQEGWDLLYDAKHPLRNGQIAKYFRGLRYRFKCTWPKLTVTQEENRRLAIYKSELTGHTLLLFPHSDNSTCYPVTIDLKAIENSWAGGMSVGHEGSLACVATEILETDPSNVLGEDYYIRILEEFPV